MAVQQVKNHIHNGVDFVIEHAETDSEMVLHNNNKLSEFLRAMFPNTGGTMFGNLKINGAFETTGTAHFKETSIFYKGINIKDFQGADVNCNIFYNSSDGGRLVMEQIAQLLITRGRINCNGLVLKDFSGVNKDCNIFFNSADNGRLILERISQLQVANGRVNCNGLVLKDFSGVNKDCNIFFNSADNGRLILERISQLQVANGRVNCNGLVLKDYSGANEDCLAFYNRTDGGRLVLERVSQLQVKGGRLNCNGVIINDFQGNPTSCSFYFNSTAGNKFILDGVGELQVPNGNIYAKRYIKSRSGFLQDLDDIGTHVVMDGRGGQGSDYGLGWYFSNGQGTFVDLYAKNVQNQCDARVKDILPSTKDLKLTPNAVENITPKKYKYHGEEKVRYGFIAQEIEEFIPEAVTTLNYSSEETNIPVDKHGNKILDCKTVDLMAIVASLWEEVKSLKGEIKNLKAKERK